MTDFLGHLVARSLHPENSLQPRPVSRFEAIPSPVSPVLETSEEIPAKPSLLSLPPRVSSKKTPSEPEMPTSMLKSARGPAEPVPDPHRGRLDAPPQTKIVIESQTIREHTLERVPTPQPVSPELPALALSAETPTKAQTLPNVPSHPEKPTPQLTVSPQLAPISPTQHTVTSPSPTLTTPGIRPLLPVVLPIQAKAPEAPLTIHVTIGRVEVRATPSTTQPSRPAKTSSVMTLDEYLQRRKAGGGA